MFPLNSNLPYIKDDGTRDKLGNVIGSGGGGGSELPDYSETDAGKVLEVDAEGELAWEVIAGTKLYYKDYTMSVQSVKELAVFSDSTASGSGIYMASPYNAPDFNIAGYRAVFASAIDVYTGYQCSVTYNVWNNNTFHLSYIFNSRADYSGVKYRVYYVKNENIEQLT